MTGLHRTIAGVRAWLQDRTRREQQEALQELHGRVRETEHRAVDAVVERPTDMPAASAAAHLGRDAHAHEQNRT